MSKKITVAFTSSYLSRGRNLPKIERNIVRSLESLGCKVSVFNIDDLTYLSSGKGLRVFAKDRDISKIDVLMIRRARYRLRHSYELADVMQQLGVTVIDSPDDFKYPNYKSIKDVHLFQQKFYPKTLIAPQISKELMSLLKKGRFKFPLVVKPVTGTKQRGVMMVKNEKELLAYPSQFQTTGVVIQEKVDTKFEYRVMVIGGKTYGAVKKEQDYLFRENNPSEFTFERNKRVEGFAKDVVKHLPGDIYGVDIAEDKKGRLYLFESNRNPSFGNFCEKSGLKIEDKIADFVVRKHLKQIKKRAI